MINSMVPSVQLEVSGDALSTRASMNRSTTMSTVRLWRPLGLGKGFEALTRDEGDGASLARAEEDGGVLATRAICRHPWCHSVGVGEDKTRRV
jgi:hypothetical protein